MTSKEVPEIQSRIYRIRGQQVMLDRDLAALYQVHAKQLKRQVRRNMDRFPLDFMFALSKQEYQILRCQFGTLSWGSHSKYLPYAFTEHGVTMLSSVLNSKQAIQVNIAIVRVFVKLRRAVIASRDVAGRVEKLEGKIHVHETDIRLLRDDVKDLKQKAGPPPSFKVKGFE